MTLQFPNNPNTGQQYTASNNLIYQWDGEKWITRGTAQASGDFVLTSGDNMSGDLTLGTDRITLNAADGSITAAGDIQSTSQNGGPLSGFRNLIQNGNFSINQRSSNNTNITTFTTQSYVCDRWTVQGNTNNNTTPIDQVNIANAGAQPKGFPSQIKLNTTSSGLSIVKLGQPIELPVAGQSYPFVSGSQWTLSFWASEDLSAQTASSVLFRDSAFASLNQVIAASGGAYGAAIETELVNSTTWYKHSYTYTISDTAASTNTCALFQISAPAGGTIRFTGVQLEPGPVATPFEHRPIQTELALCQRYYFNYGQKIYYANPSATPANVTRVANVMFPVTMRTEPTVTLTGGGSGFGGGGGATETISTVGLTLKATASGQNNTGISNGYTADAEMASSTPTATYTYEWTSAEQEGLRRTDAEGNVAFVPADPGNRDYAEFLSSGQAAADYVEPPAPPEPTTEEKVNRLLSDYGLTRDEMRVVLAAK